MTDILQTKVSDIEPFELAHFGVKGMKWGVRNDERRIKKARKTGDFSKLSGDQLRELTSRLAVESQARGHLPDSVKRQQEAKHLAKQLRKQNKAAKASARLDRKQRKRLLSDQKKIETKYAQKQQEARQKSQPKQKRKSLTGKVAGLPLAILTMTGKKVIKAGTNQLASEISKKYVSPQIGKIFKDAGGTAFKDIKVPPPPPKSKKSSSPPPSDWGISDMLALPSGVIDLKYDDIDGVWR